jgi:N-acetylglucosaminyldiphosphoundecaprenol N-acetyl-beta-D-mannosaminyltransferase
MPTKSAELILYYLITVKSKEACISEIHSWIKNNKKGKYFVCANPHSLEVAKTDTLFHEAIKGADLIVPDGIGIIIASKIMDGRISNRITGSDIFWELSNSLNKEGSYSYFFLGSTNDTLKRIQEKMRKDFKNIRVAGTFSPPFKSEFSHYDNALMIEKINSTKPDVLWVGMTAPKQEKWIYQNKDKLQVKFIGAVGAVFDFYTGVVERSNPWFLDHGLEWLPRFLQQPRRLWRRNLVSNPIFLIRILMKKYLIRSSKNIK